LTPIVVMKKGSKTAKYTQKPFLLTKGEKSREFPGCTDSKSKSKCPEERSPPKQEVVELGLGKEVEV